MVLESFKKAFTKEKPVIEDINKEVGNILFALIEEMNERRPDDQKIAVEKSTQLFGEGGVLDSLELVNLIVAFEQKIQSDLDCVITLADEKAMSQKRNPFRSIESLADYAMMLIKEKVNG